MGHEQLIRRLLKQRGGVVTTGELLAAGMSRHELRWALRQRVLTTLRHGVHTSTADYEAYKRGDPQRRHVVELLAEQRVHPQLVASGCSAAIVLGLPTPHGAPEQPLNTAPSRDPGGARRGRRAGALTRQAHLLQHEVWRLRNGLRVTSPVRTALDCAREWDRPWGLAIADAVVGQGRGTCDELVAEAKRRSGVPHGLQALWVAQHTRPFVESPLESLARAVIVLAGLPEPTTQVSLRTRLGLFRVDLLDEAHRLITEADGRRKYERRQDLYDEKRREDALRELGYGMVRFGMEDYAAPGPWLAVYRRSLATFATQMPMNQG